MRESALFLLGLLVAVSVDVARLLVYADLCASVSFVGRWNVRCEPTERGVRWDSSGEYGRRWIPFFDARIEKLRRYLATIPILQPIDTRCLGNLNFNKKTFIGRKNTFRITVFRRKFFETADERDEERGMHYKNKRKRCYKKYVWQIIRDKVTSIRDVN